MARLSGRAPYCGSPPTSARRAFAAGGSAPQVSRYARPAPTRRVEAAWRASSEESPAIRATLAALAEVAPAAASVRMGP